jgi:hypothetical protein
MSAKLYEIIRLEDGSFALQRADGEGEPLVKVQFSEEAEHFLADSVVEIAKVMIDAGVDAVDDLSKYSDNGDDFEAATDTPRVLH